MSQHEKINYIELPANNLATVKTFYATAFGWSFVDYGPDYASITDAGLDGGFFKSEKASTTQMGSALVILYSNDLEATQQKVSEAGGEINQAIFSFPGGRRFHFKDPNGNELAVWSDQGLD